MPLKNIPSVLSPQLLCTLAEMGHGDEIVFADAHFPTSSICRSGPKELRADGVNIPDLLRGVCHVLPLDTYVTCPVAVMAVTDGDKAKGVPTPRIWSDYKEIIDLAESTYVQFEEVERFAFYERAKKSFAVVATGETATYANIILKKGLAK